MIFENESLKVDAEEKEGCLLSLQIQVTPLAVQKAYKNAIKRINKEISIPGFRKGKAPDATIEKNYAPQIEKEWREIVLDEACNGAIKLTQKAPLNNRSFHKPRIEKFSKEEGALVFFSYEHFPNLPSVDLSKIELPSIETREVKESEIENVMQEIQKDFANFEEIQGRGVEMNDFARITLEGIETEKTIPLVTNRRIEVGGENFPSWLKNLILGVQIGEVKDFEHNEEEGLKGLPKHIRLTLHAIEQRTLLEINDELAKKAGFESFDAMKAEIEKNLKRSNEEEASVKKYDALANALVDKYPFDLPRTLVKDLLEKNLSREISKLPDEERESKRAEIEKEVEEEVTRKLRLYYLIREIGVNKGINLSQGELNQHIEAALKQNPLFFGDTKDKEGLRQRINRFADKLLEEKILAFALSEVEKAQVA